MARVFITGSSDGLGRLAARLLVGQGHSVVLHARNEARGRDTMAAVPGAQAVLTGDLASLAETRALAAAADAAGPFDAVVHNAAVGFREKRRIATADGLPLSPPAPEGSRAGRRGTRRGRSGCWPSAGGCRGWTCRPLER